MFPCWSDGPRPTGRDVPPCAGWVGPTALLCLYGFCSTVRPIEPFLTEFLTGGDKNLTTRQVTRQVFPVWTYSSLVLLAPVLLLTDALRYKPAIVLQGLTCVTAFLLLILGSGVRSAQAAFFFYSVAMATDVAYFSYIYTLVPPGYYQRATSYVKGAVLLGNAVGSLLGQLLVSLGGVSLLWLAFLTLVFLSVALITSCFLPMPKSGLFPAGAPPAQQGASGGGTQTSERWTVPTWVQSVKTTMRRLASDCQECYSSVGVVFFCVWAATGRCGFYQVVGYVQVLWAHIQPHNASAYNGGVDAISTLTGAAGTVAVGHVSLEWSTWGELVLGGSTFLLAVALFLMDWTGSVGVSYACFFLFKTLYMPLTAICSFQIARTLPRRRYALVFGVNSLVGSVLQSVLTAIVINNTSVELSITSQFFIYSSFFAAVSLLFAIRGVYSVLRVKWRVGDHGAERTTRLPEQVSHL
ncbi:thiamine transporter 1-like isoform X2 [Antennarius striatus]|uniref:thiamine transporter 1-like isoform X2 n=1 Tax=Antennarius striatus TaxID=241820 RepID=UPI0035B186FA